MGQSLQPGCTKVTNGLVMGASADAPRSRTSDGGRWCGGEDRRLCKPHFSTCCGTDQAPPAEETQDEPWCDRTAQGSGSSDRDKCEVPGGDNQTDFSSHEVATPSGKSVLTPVTSENVVIVVPEAKKDPAGNPGGQLLVNGKVVSPSDEPEGIKEGVPLLDAVPLDTADPNFREITCTRGKYVGQVSSETGEFCGLGRLTMQESTAVGVWQKDFLHGPGHEAWHDGRRYGGEFLAGAFSGHGRMQWYHPRGGMVYDGQYLEDRKHGWGRFTWPSGRAYEGQWVSGRREGLGVEISASGSKSSGLWEDNVFLATVQEDADSCRTGLDEEGQRNAAAATQRAEAAARASGLLAPDGQPLWPPLPSAQ